MAAAATASMTPAAASALLVDGARSQVHFDIGVLVLLKRSGTFSALEGQIEVDAAARLAHIQIRIPTSSAKMKDPEQTALLLSQEFFDARSHPWIEFRSDAFPLESTPGPRRVRGTLSIRGVERSVVFSVQADACLDTPGLHSCQIRVEGTIKRSSFGMVAYRRTLADQVNLRIDVLLKPAETARRGAVKRSGTRSKAAPRSSR